MEAPDTRTSIPLSEWVVIAASTKMPEHDAKAWLLAGAMRFDHKRVTTYSDQITFLVSEST